MTPSDFAFTLFLQPAWMLIGIVGALCTTIAVLVWLAVFRVIRIPKALAPQAAFHTGVTGLFALFLTFTASDAWRRSDAAYTALLREAVEIATLVQAIEVMPDAEAAAQQRTLLRLYLRASLTGEWAEQNAVMSQAASDALDALRRQALSQILGPQSLLWRLSLDRIEGLSQARMTRLVAGGLYGDMLRWAGLMLLFTVGVASMAVVHLADPRTAALAMGTYATGAAIALAVVVAFEHPYAGWDGTTSDRLVELLARLG